MLSQLFLLAQLTLLQHGLTIKVASLSGVRGNAWKKGVAAEVCLNTTDAGHGWIDCNLQVYEASIATAAREGAQIIVLPEAYALDPAPTKRSVFEVQGSTVGSVPCDDVDPSRTPQQAAISCMAKRHKVGVAANIFTSLPNNSRRITEVVFDGDGRVLETHDKLHLFRLTEQSIFDAGHSLPKTFEFLGHRWGTLICYEGVYPFTHGGSFAEIESLVSQGATGLLWSIGGEVPPGLFGTRIAKKFGVSVTAAETNTLLSRTIAVVDRRGREVPLRKVELDLTSIGYTAKATVNIADLSETVVV